ncbi:MAG: aminotransferase class I/II-fold pyridoxal phosphate-dependent enzyme, partial [Pseudomonadota bacterium]
PEADWITTVHGLVSGIGLTVQAMTEPGDGVIVFAPVYHMFGNTIRAAGRRVIESPLREIQGRYEMDFEALDELSDGAKMVLLCSPHNPGGRVWNVEELRQLADFCERRGLILVSDEIHMDLVFSESTHTIMAKAAPEVLDRLVTLVAPTKTFNIAGALTGFPIISNPELRQKFAAQKAACGLGAANRFGTIAATAAYQHGAAWLDALIPYLQSNRDRLDQAVAENLPGVRSMRLEATYLAWLNFSGLGLSPAEVLDKINKDARIVVNDGPSFGLGGDNWLRFNFACPRQTLETAIERLIATLG